LNDSSGIAVVKVPSTWMWLQPGVLKERAIQ